MVSSYFDNQKRMLISFSPIGYFKSWINEEKSGKNKEDVLVLEHELNHATVNMTEK